MNLLVIVIVLSKIIKYLPKNLKIKYEININHYEINNLTFTNIIDKIEFNQIALNMQIMDWNEIEIKNNLLNKYNDKNSIFIRKIIPYSKCFF